MIANDKFQLLSMGRGFGRTEVMLRGAANIPNAIVVCANASHEHDIRTRAPNVQTVRLDNLDSIRGLNQPVVFDHFALEQLWYEREMETRELIRKIKEQSK